jgi:hypothetical protein
VAILHFKVNHDANSLEHSLVILKNTFDWGVSMTEMLIKSMEVLDPGIEGFMTGFSSVLEFPDSWGVKWVSDANLFWLTLAAFITDCPLVLAGILLLKPFGLPCRKGTVDPNKFVAADGDS